MTLIIPVFIYDPGAGGGLQDRFVHKTGQIIIKSN